LLALFFSRRGALHLYGGLSPQFPSFAATMVPMFSNFRHISTNRYLRVLACLVYSSSSLPLWPTPRIMPLEGVVFLLGIREFSAPFNPKKTLLPFRMMRTSVLLQCTPPVSAEILITPQRFASSNFSCRSLWSPFILLSTSIALTTGFHSVTMLNFRPQYDFQPIRPQGLPLSFRPSWVLKAYASTLGRGQVLSFFSRLEVPPKD